LFAALSDSPLTFVFICILAPGTAAIYLNAVGFSDPSSRLERLFRSSVWPSSDSDHFRSLVSLVCASHAFLIVLQALFTFLFLILTRGSKLTACRPVFFPEAHWKRFISEHPFADSSQGRLRICPVFRESCRRFLQQFMLKSPSESFFRMHVFFF